jgi:16S rRNA (uracil1498-N3)-methyltransferase
MTRLRVDTVPEPPGTIEIEGDELHYLARVRRHREGDPVEVTDRRGRRFAARVIRLSRTGAELAIERALPPAPDAWPVTMLVAIPKGTLLDDVVRKLNELGIARLVPVIAERTNARPEQGRLERWRRIAAESTRQCGRQEPIEISAVTELTAALADHGDADQRLILDPGEAEAGFSAAIEGERDRCSMVVAVGPEGGFAPAELALARREGFRTARLGPSILRVETAAIAAATLAVAFLGGFD